MHLSRFMGWAACALLATACPPSSAHLDAGAEPTLLPRVRVEQAQRGPVDRVVEVTGILSAVPGRDVKLGALVQGRLSKVTVAEGDSVKSGDVLAEIESGPASDELTQAEATVQEAEEAARAATAHRLRTEDLLRKGAASEQDAERARSDDVSARSAALRAKAAVDMARRKLSRTQLRAPFDGVVVAVYTRSGEVVDGNGQAVVEVAAPNPLELRAAVSPRDAALLRPSMSAHVRVDALKLEREGSVFAVAPAADPASGNVLVRVRLDDAEHALKLGVLARATVRVDHLDDVVTVSRDSLVPGPDGGAGVVLVDDGKAHPVGVDVGFYVDGRAVVSRGLDGGESVVAQGGYALPEGAEVEVVP